METKRKHVPTWLYKLGGRLDKQYEEIVSALSDINAFNAGKKRDKALELIAAWLPNVEKFSKEISKDVYKRQIHSMSENGRKPVKKISASATVLLTLKVEVQSP